MIKKTIKYINFEDQEITEDFYFNLTQAEIIEIEATYGEKGFQGVLDELTKTQDGVKAYNLFKQLIGWSFGEKSEDGKRFLKRPEMFESFTHTEAYSELLFEFVKAPEAAAEFFQQLMPKKLRDSQEFQDARVKSEAQMQGFKKKEQPTVTTVPNLPSEEHSSLIAVNTQPEVIVASEPENLPPTPEPGPTPTNEPSNEELMRMLKARGLETN